MFPGQSRQRKLGITIEEGSEKRPDLERRCWAQGLRRVGHKHEEDTSWSEAVMAGIGLKVGGKMK